MEKRPHQSKSWVSPRIRFNRVRDVLLPTRANEGDAGLDFYIPKDLSAKEFLEKNPGQEEIITRVDAHTNVREIVVRPHHRVLIPSGIRCLLEPQNSMLQANNKSGVSTKKGLIFTAQVVDSPYTGEIHIGVANISEEPAILKVGIDPEKGKEIAVVQFIHIPIFLTNPDEIGSEEYDTLAKDWGTRGAGGFGSSDGLLTVEEQLAIIDAQNSI